MINLVQQLQDRVSELLQFNNEFEERARVAERRVKLTDKIERYTVRAGGEWAYIYVDEANGVFTSYSSFGNYAYQWRSIGSDTLKEFLSDLDFSYFMGEARRDYLRFDPEATIDGIKRYIIERRRDGSLTREEARDAWNDLDHMDGGDESFFDGFYRSEALMAVYGGDYCDIARERPDSDSRGFWEKIWPEFLKQIAASADGKVAA